MTVVVLEEERRRRTGAERAQVRGTSAGFGCVRRHHGPDIADDADRHRSVCGADRAEQVADRAMMAVAILIDLQPRGSRCITNQDDVTIGIIVELMARDEPRPSGTAQKRGQQDAGNNTTGSHGGFDHSRARRNASQASE